MRKETFIKGDHWIIDDISGQKVRRSESRFNWKGQLVHISNWEPKHPQIDIRGRKEKIAVTDGTRTQSDDPPLLDPPITGDDLI